MISFSQVMDGLKAGAEDTWLGQISPDWMQGRTTYGGMSAALSLRAVMNANKDLPPLRSAQINFIGPAGGEVSMSSNVLRRGRSVAFVESLVTSGADLATQSVFCFGEQRDSRLDRSFVEKPTVLSVEQSQPFFKNSPGPAFAQHFECLLAAGDPPFSSSDKGDIYVWVRHKDKKANDLPALLGVADMPPPAVFPMFDAFAPISSMTWMINMLTEQPCTEDGWWLMRSRAEHVQNGYASQDMTIWNSALEAVQVGRQNVAIFY